MSQDHLESLFACIRGKNGFNNNPNVRHFKSSLKRILLRHTIVSSKHANYVMFELQSIGSVFSIKWSSHRSPIQINSVIESEVNYLSLISQRDRAEYWNTPCRRRTFLREYFDWLKVTLF